MTKAELIERIVDSFWAMSGENPGDYVDLTPMDLEEATMYLSEARATERSCDLEPDECLPEEVTPELYMEAWNCYLRMMQYRAKEEARSAQEEPVQEPQDPQVEFLMVNLDEGKEYTMSFRADMPVGSVAEIISPLMLRSIISDVSIREEVIA